ncbi:MAG: hypothetical protein M1826_002676 [Phylliscum demangeonii]|nr:MAG: hypothetical protein M1826_002676 [Phylliscum demangeonii]
MEGLLLVPPDKNAILTRSQWKTRYVSLGPSSPPSRPVHPRSTSSSSLRLNSSLRQMKLGSRNVSQVSVEQLAAAEEAWWIHIFKHKGDLDPISSYPASSIISCTIHDYAYRKTSSVQPTLMVTVHTGDPKRVRQARRLSQSHPASCSTAGQSQTMLFRSVPSAPHSIRDWHRVVQEQLLPAPGPDAGPDTAALPPSSSHKSSRPSTSGTRPGIPPSQGSHVSVTSSQPGSALSIRTTRTGASSPTSISPHHASKSMYEAGPSSSSPLSEHFRTPSPFRPGSPPPASPSAASSAAAAAAPPRETILDRAFKRNCIPGAGAYAAGEPTTTMNSIARFEALMQDLEARRASEARGPASVVEGGDHAGSEPRSRAPPDLLPPSARRALEYISSGQAHSRSTSASASTITSPISPGATSPPLPPLPGPRARRPGHGSGHGGSGSGSSRPSRPTSLALPPSYSTSNVPTMRASAMDALTGAGHVDRRRSSISTAASSSTSTTTSTATGAGVGGNNNYNMLNLSISNKRLSLVDFHRRLSSSSSLILARTTTTATATSSRSSGVSDASFHCVGEDDGGGAAGAGGASSAASSIWGVSALGRAAAGAHPLPPSPMPVPAGGF